MAPGPACAPAPGSAVAGAPDCSAAPALTEPCAGSAGCATTPGAPGCPAPPSRGAVLGCVGARGAGVAGAGAWPLGGGATAGAGAAAGGATAGAGSAPMAGAAAVGGAFVAGLVAAGGVVGRAAGGEAGAVCAATSSVGRTTQSAVTRCESRDMRASQLKAPAFVTGAVRDPQTFSRVSADQKNASGGKSATTYSSSPANNGISRVSTTELIGRPVRSSSSTVAQ